MGIEQFFLRVEEFTAALDSKGWMLYGYGTLNKIAIELGPVKILTVGQKYALLPKVDNPTDRQAVEEARQSPDRRLYLEWSSPQGRRQVDSIRFELMKMIFFYGCEPVIDCCYEGAVDCIQTIFGPTLVPSRLPEGW